jgi:Zn-dependent peptidase ImmA (M78 family)/transcriptional regulator with XRE-family HTH domain
MASHKVNSISTEILRWAFQRAGFEEEQAKEAFPLLSDWLSNKKVPTMSGLEKFANKFHVPFGYLFLTTPPQESIPFPMFRGSAGQSNHFDLDVYDTVMNISRRQDWLEDYLEDNEIETSPLVGVVTEKTPISETVQRLRDFLRLGPRWAFGLASSDAAVSMMNERLEDCGVFIAYNGVVGNNTHRVLKVSECRGFALVNKIAPYIFVNSGDSKTAQLFTLVHETAHLMLGISAGHAGDEFGSSVGYEHYCDAVAAEFLVPTAELTKIWNKDLKYIARRFKVSEIVIARKAHDLNLMTDEEYKNFYSMYKSRPISANKRSDGGNFYLTSVKRVGRLFAIHVRNAVNSRQLNYTEAYRLTGLYGKTYEQFMTNNL